VKIGAVWLREKDGKKYMSGVIEYPGQKLNFAIFRNEEKKADNQPDYNIVWNPPKENGPKAPADSGGGHDDDIPF
jgi:uncharacterized protein (DUF736 family)